MLDEFLVPLRTAATEAFRKVAGRSAALLILAFLGIAFFVAASAVDAPAAHFLLAFGSLTLLVTLSGLMLWVISDWLLHRGAVESQQILPDEPPPIDPARELAANSEFQKAWAKIWAAVGSSTPEDLLRDLTNACVRSCMVAKGLGELDVRDYDRFWVKLYRLERVDHGRLELAPVVCSSNTPPHERNIRLIFNEGGAGYVLAQSLRAIERGGSVKDVYMCDRLKAIARLRPSNRVDLERSAFEGECCFPILSNSKKANVRLYGVACFCVSTKDGFGQLGLPAKQSRIANVCRYAASLLARSSGKWGEWEVPIDRHFDTVTDEPADRVGNSAI